MGDRIMKDRIMKKNGPHDPVIMPGRDVGIQFTCSKVCRAVWQIIWILHWLGKSRTA